MMEDQQMDKLEKKRLYKQNYQRLYYQKKRADPAFLEKRKETAKAHYKYSRKTIDCADCGVRHPPDCSTCLLVAKARTSLHSEPPVSSQND